MTGPALPYPAGARKITTIQEPRLSTESDHLTGTRSFLLVAVASFVIIVAVLGLLQMSGFTQNSWANWLLAGAIGAAAIAVAVFWLVLLPVQRRLDGKGKSMELDVLPVKQGEQVSITDPLTGIMNRHGITVSVLDAMALGERYGYPLSIALLDIDHLRKLNMEYGQDFGDQVLATVAGIIADSLRMPDKVGRFSGHEFLLVLPHTEIDDAAAIAERTRALVADHDFDAGGQRVKLTCSVGVTQYTQSEDIEAMLSRAASGVDAARDKGRNTTVAV